MAKTIKEIKNLTRGVGFGNKATIELSSADVAAITNAEINAKDEGEEENSQVEPEAKPKTKPKTNEVVNVEVEVEPPLGLDMEAVQNMISTAIATSNDAHKQELEVSAATHQQEINELRTQHEVDLNAAKAETESLQAIITTLGLDKFKGNPQPVNNDNDAPPLSGTMSVLGTGSPASRQFNMLIEQAPYAYVTTKQMGRTKQRDLRRADQYFNEHRSEIREGVEAEMRNAGFFGANATTNAPTAIADIPSLSFEYLSAFIRLTHYPDLIHWQFGNYALELGTKPGLFIDVPRYEDLPKPTTFAEVMGTVNTSVSNTSQPITEKNVVIEIKELFLQEPVAVSTFLMAYSLNDLERIVGEKLGRHYQYSKDLGLRSQWFATNRVVYNNNGFVTVNPGDVGADAGGNITPTFLVNLRSYMKGLEIPTYRDDCYGLALNPGAIAQYMSTKSDRERDMAMHSGKDLVSNMLAQSTGNQYGGEVSGYRGSFDGFHFFEQNVYGKGADGEEGSQNVALGAGETLCDSSFAFGPNTVAWCTGLPVEIRKDEVRDFGRQDRCIWYSHENAGALNVKNDAATGEQLRVIEIRNARIPV